MSKTYLTFVLRKCFFMLFLGVALIVLSLSASGQQVNAGAFGDNRGISPFVEARKEFKEPFLGDSITFGPRLGYVWKVFSDYDYFYFQQVAKYKGFIFSPCWLRSYSKAIGYQVPTSIGYEYNRTSVWLNYTFHARQIDFHIIYRLHDSEN